MKEILVWIKNLTGINLTVFAAVFAISEFFWNLGAIIMAVDRGTMVQWRLDPRVIVEYLEAFKTLQFTLSPLFIVGFLINRIAAFVPESYLLLIRNKRAKLAPAIAMYAWLDLCSTVGITIGFFIPAFNKFYVIMVGIALFIVMLTSKWILKKYYNLSFDI